MKGEMTLRSTSSQLHWWPLFSAATLLFLLGETVGEDWDERFGGATYPAVEYVSEKTSKTYNIPLELNEDPFFLVEWSTEASRLRRGFRFILPPGILLVASIATAALLFVWNRSGGSPFKFKRKKTNEEPGEVSSESEEPYGLLESEYGADMDSSSVLQSVLREFSAVFENAVEETRGRKSTAVELLNDSSISDSISPGMAEIIPYLLEATDKLAAPAKGIGHALDVLQLPLSDSQAVFRLNSALEEMHKGIQEPLHDSFLQAELEAARLYLGLGEGPMSEILHMQPDDQPVVRRRGISIMGQPDTGDATGQRVMEKLSDWLEALFAQQRLLVDALPVVSKAVADVRAVYDLV